MLSLQLTWGCYGILKSFNEPLTITPYVESNVDVSG